MIVEHLFIVNAKTLSILEQRWKLWTNWFNWDGPKLPSPFKKLKVEYRDEKL